MSSFRFYFRLLLLVPLRFFAIVLLAFFAQNFEVSPFPEWTLAVFVYVVLFVLTYGFTRFALRHYALTTRAVVSMAIGFLGLGTVLELGFGYFFSTTGLADHLRQLSWRDFVPLAIHAFAFTMAVLRVKQKREAIRALVTTPEDPVVLE